MTELLEHQEELLELHDELERDEVERELDEARLSTKMDVYKQEKMLEAVQAHAALEDITARESEVQAQLEALQAAVAAAEQEYEEEQLAYEEEQEALAEEAYAVHQQLQHHEMMGPTGSYTSDSEEIPLQTEHRANGMQPPAGFGGPPGYRNVREATRYLLWLAFDMYRRGTVSLDQKLAIKLMIINQHTPLFELAARCQQNPDILRQVLPQLV